MIALRPPSYHTIEDPPPYPDDDDDVDRPLMAAGDKRPAHSSVALTNRTGVEHLLANSSELLQLCDHDDAVDQPVTRPTAADIAVRRQYRDAVGGRRRADPPTCRPGVYNVHDEQITDPLTPWTHGRTRWTDCPDTERFWRHEHCHQLVFDLPPAGTGGNRFSPRRSTVQANVGSPRHADRSARVPYSVTCPSCFDGCLLDAARHVQPLVRQVPRPSVSGEPVTSAAARSARDRACEARQTSSVFEISSYIIASRASSASVQPSDAV